MKKRIIFGIVMIALLSGLLYLDWRLGRSHANLGVGLPLAALFVPMVAMAFAEVGRFCAGAGLRVLPVSGLAGTMLLATLPYTWQFAGRGDLHAAGLAVLLGLIVMGVFAEQMIRSRIADAVAQIAATLLAVLYLGVGGLLILQLRATYEVGGLVLFLAAVKCTDIGAYFTGSFLGRHKMIPWLSPGKSWEGLAGGVVTAALVSALAVKLLPAPAISLPAAMGFGAIIGLVGQFADLCESLLKRAAHVKDSGALVPEFGGIMDIIDSPLLAAPAAHLLLGLWTFG